VHKCHPVKTEVRATLIAVDVLHVIRYEGNWRLIMWVNVVQQTATKHANSCYTLFVQ